MSRSQQSIDTVLERQNMGAYRWGLYVACGVLMALEGYDAYVVANLAAVIARGLNIPIPSMGFVFTAQAAGMALGYYTIPMLADRIGRRNIIIVGSAMFGLLTLGSTLATTLETFMVVRFLAFMSLGVVVLVLGSRIGVPTAIVTLAAILVPPAHIYKQLKRAYGLGRFGAVWRTSVLLIMTSITLSLFAGFVLYLGSD